MDSSGNGKGVGSLRGRALRKHVLALINQLGHAEEHIREAAINALAAIGRKAVPFLVAVLDDGDIIVRLGALPGLGGLLSPGYSFQQELLYRCRQAGCSIGEVPIVFENRRAGASKINIKEGVHSISVIAWIVFGMGSPNA